MFSGFEIDAGNHIAIILLCRLNFSPAICSEPERDAKPQEVLAPADYACLEIAMNEFETPNLAGARQKTALLAQTRLRPALLAGGGTGRCKLRDMGKPKEKPTVEQVLKLVEELHRNIQIGLEQAERGELMDGDEDSGFYESGTQR